MSTFFVNGKSVTTTRKQSLLRFLRDELKLTSVKVHAGHAVTLHCITFKTARPLFRGLAVLISQIMNTYVIAACYPIIIFSCQK